MTEKFNVLEIHAVAPASDNASGIIASAAASDRNVAGSSSAANVSHSVPVQKERPTAYDTPSRKTTYASRGYTLFLSPTTSASFLLFSSVIK